MIRLLPALLACLFLLVRYTPVEAKERFFCYVSLGGEDRIAVYPLDPATGKLGEPRHFSVGGAHRLPGGRSDEAIPLRRGALDRERGGTQD